MVAEQVVGDSSQYMVPQGKWGTFVHENPEVQLTYSQVRGPTLPRSPSIQFIASSMPGGAGS